MKYRRLWLISEVFYPDTDIATGSIATEIALKFSESFDVHVISGPAGYEISANGNGGGNTIGKDIGGKITIHRVNSFNFNKNGKILRLVRVIGISILMFVKGFAIGSEDTVFVISNPAFITLLYGWLKRIKKFKYILLMHDVFPENLVPAGFVKPSNIFFRCLKKTFVRSRRNADRIIVLGRDMKNILQEERVSLTEERIEVIPNWADIDNIYPCSFYENAIIKELNLKDKIVISFAGNHGVLQNLLEFLKLIEKVKNPILHFIFAGGGATKDLMMEYVTKKKLSNVSFLKAFPKSELLHYQNACTIGLVSLKDDLYGVGVPSKSYNICAAGKPIMFVGNPESEIAKFVSEKEVGWSFSYKDNDEVIKFLEQLKLSDLEYINECGLRGRSVVVAEYNRSLILDRLTEAVI